MTEPDPHPEPGPDGGHRRNPRPDIERTRDQLGEDRRSVVEQSSTLKQRAKQKSCGHKGNS